MYKYLQFIYFLDQLELLIVSLMERSEVGGLWRCRECDYSSGVRTDVARHVEARHVDSTVSCDICGYVTNTRKALKMHKYRNHRD